MSNPIDISPSAPADDFFVEYLTEKLWAWIPSEYKLRDGQGDNPGALRGIVEVMAQQAAVSRRSTDRLWEDQYIEFCDDWAVPLIGQLVATRMLNPLNRRGRRVDVAKTIFYRRRKGTPFVIDTLIRDVTGWTGVVVEAFKRLHREWHELDPQPGGRLGPVTHTPPGGWPDLRSPRAEELVGGPFDEFFYTPDVRRKRGCRGRFNLPKVNLHLYRVPAFEVRLATPVAAGEDRYFIDPSARDIALYRPNQRPEPDDWEPAQEWQIDDKIPCRLLNAWGFVVTSEAIEALRAELAPPDQGDADELYRYAGEYFATRARLEQTVAALPAGAVLSTEVDTLVAGSVDMTSPKEELWGGEGALLIGVADLGGVVTDLDTTQIAAANLDQWGQALPDGVWVDPCRGRVLRVPETVDAPIAVPVYHYGLAGPVGAGTYSRRASVVPGGTEIVPPNPIPQEQMWTVPTAPISGVDDFGDSQTYVASDDLVGITEYVLQARDQQRPYVVRQDDDPEWVFEAEGGAGARTLELDGLWIGLQRLTRDMGPNPTPVLGSLILQGDWDRVVIRNCTLDPGGVTGAFNPAGDHAAIPTVRLLIDGTVAELVIDNSIVGPIEEAVTTSDPCSVERIVVRDSIVDASATDIPAIAVPRGEVCLERSTVFGDVRVNRLFATETLIQGEVRVDDNQNGCFRFSAANDTEATRLPRQFESHLYAPAVPNHVFTSRRFGDPGYAQLSQTAPLELVRGAENGSEIGVYSRLLNPIKFDDLRTKVDEYLPFGLIPQYVFET